ncbi:unnamed protein product, partial [Ilex paraguariensis]
MSKALGDTRKQLGSDTKGDSGGGPGVLSDARGLPGAVCAASGTSQVVPTSWVVMGKVQQATGAR